MEMPAMQLLRIPQKKAWHGCHGYANSTRHQVYGNASNAAAAHTTKESLAWLPWLCKLYSAPSIWKCQQCSCCAYHKRKPGIAAMVMQTLLGTKYMEMPAMQLLRAPHKKAWHCCHGYANSTRHCISLWKCQQCSCCA